MLTYLEIIRGRIGVASVPFFHETDEKRIGEVKGQRQREDEPFFKYPFFLNFLNRNSRRGVELHSLAIRLGQSTDRCFSFY